VVTARDLDRLDRSRREFHEELVQAERRFREVTDPSAAPVGP
jgi:hypothetical protein